MFLKSKLAAALLLLTGCGALRAQETLTLDDMAKAADEWARDNLDEHFLRSLGDVDQRKVEEFLQKLRKEFQGEYVIDLAQLRASAGPVVALLESYEETVPYAVWLKARLDYFEVADQLRLIIPPPTPKAGELPRPVLVPPTKLREIWIRKYIERPVPEQARPFLPQLKSIFAAEKIPPELVWVAEVESSFDPRARSPVGAAGLYQLMPATAKQYGLRTWPLDQRLKLETNARAAARHLKRLQARYQDWRLTLAAYNAGEGTVDALLARRKTRSFDAIASRLPAETQLYVPKVEAAIKQREGVKLTELPTTPGA